MRVGGDEDRLELTQGAERCGGDVYLLASVNYGGFAGSIDTWIVRAAWDAFVADLRLLDQSRRGAAAVESMSPGELLLTFSAIDAVGHVAVSGEIARRDLKQVSLRFANIEFDPTSLPRVVEELASW